VLERKQEDAERQRHRSEVQLMLYFVAEAHRIQTAQALWAVRVVEATLEFWMFVVAPYYRGR